MKKLTEITNVLFDKTSVVICSTTMNQLTGGREMKNYTATGSPKTSGNPTGQQFDGWDSE